MLQRRLSFVLQASSSHSSPSSSSSHVAMGRRNSLPLMMVATNSTHWPNNNNNSSDGPLSRQFSTNPRWTNKDESTLGGSSPRIVESISSTVTLTEKRVRQRRRSMSGFFVGDTMRRQRDASLMMERLRRQQTETSVFDQYSSHMMDEWKGYAEEPDESKSQNRCDL